MKHIFFKKELKNVRIIEASDSPGKYGYLIVEYDNKRGKTRKKISIRRSVFDEVYHKSSAEVYYDDFLLEDFYFLDKLPYFTGKLILNYIVLFLSILPLLYSLLRKA